MGGYRVVAHHILFYEYVEDVLERRGPYREEHLARIASEREEGRVVIAGSLGDPPHGAAIAFGPDVSVDEIEAFAADDPYVRGGLVAARRVERWNVV
jgi:uncharacterized protein YciI